MTYGNCDNTALTTEHGTTNQAHCHAPNNGGSYFLTEAFSGNSRQYALGGNCRSAVYKMH
jgi:hypothetical protein